MRHASDTGPFSGAIDILPGSVSLLVDGDDAVLRAPITSWPIKRPLVGRTNCRRGADPVAAYPVKTRSPSVRTLVVCAGGLDSIALHPA
jgi:hypothetical protein